MSRDIKLPLAVVPFPSITYYITDADGNILGCSADERDAYRIKDETEVALRVAAHAGAK